jgi:hypothetical protein
MYDGVELDVVRPAVAEGDREIDIRGRRSILAAVAATYKAPSGWETPKSRAVRPKFSCHDRDRRDSLASYARLPRCALYARCAMCRYVRCLTTHSTGIPRRERRRRAEAEARRHRRAPEHPLGRQYANAGIVVRLVSNPAAQRAQYAGIGIPAGERLHGRATASFAKESRQ